MDSSTTRRATSSQTQARKLAPSRIRVSFDAAAHIQDMGQQIVNNFIPVEARSKKYLLFRIE